MILCKRRRECYLGSVFDCQHLSALFFLGRHCHYFFNYCIHPFSFLHWFTVHFDCTFFLIIMICTCKFLRYVWEMSNKYWVKYGCVTSIINLKYFLEFPIFGSRSKWYFRSFLKSALIDHLRYFYLVLISFFLPSVRLSFHNWLFPRSSLLNWSFGYFFNCHFLCISIPILCQNISSSPAKRQVSSFRSIFSLSRLLKPFLPFSTGIVMMCSVQSTALLSIKTQALRQYSVSSRFLLLCSHSDFSPFFASDSYSLS